MSASSFARLGKVTLAMTAGMFFGLAASAPARAQDSPALTKVASFEHQATGIAVGKDGRVFVSFPRWSEDASVSVAELKDGKPVPYPNAEWNRWRNALKDKVEAKDHFVCVQTVEADHAGNIWVLDAGAPAMAALVPGAAKLVEIDGKSNQVTRVVRFDDTVAPQGSYINDVRFSPDDKTAYLTDSGAKGGLVVVDMASGKSRRVLDGYPQTQADPDVTVMYDGKPLRRPDGRGVDFTADGLALSVDGKTLYWQAIKGKTLYSVPTDAIAGGFTTAVLPETLTDHSVAGKVAVVGDNGPADGLIISRADGKMYITSPQDDSIKVRDLAHNGSAPTVLIKDARLRWPDTFGEGPDGTLYLTTSHIQDSAYFKLGAPIALPTELWSFKPAGK